MIIQTRCCYGFSQDPAGRDDKRIVLHLQTISVKISVFQVNGEKWFSFP